MTEYQGDILPTSEAPLPDAGYSARIRGFPPPRPEEPHNHRNEKAIKKHPHSSPVSDTIFPFVLDRDFAPSQEAFRTSDGYSFSTYDDSEMCRNPEAG